MTCPEQPIVAFLAGELSPEEERRFDEHLLGCEHCWRAVQADRAARLALEQLRQPAPAGLQDRVTLSVAIAADEASKGAGSRSWHGPLRLAHRARASAHPRVRLVTAACLLLVVAAGAAVALVAPGRTAIDPPQVSAVAAMVTPHRPATPALRAGEHLVISGQPLVVRAYQLEGTEEIVATSSRPFPVPQSSHLLSGSSSKAWMASKGRLSMYGVNRPRGQESMFLVAAMPMADMPQMAARLGLI